MGVVLFYVLLCVAIEHISSLERYSMRSRIPGILMNIIGPVLGLSLMWPISQFWSWLNLAPVAQIPLADWLDPYGPAGFVAQVLIVFLIADFLAYWRHRAEHSRWLWPVHAVHHAPTELHAANNIGHPLQSLFSWAFIGIPMSLIKVDGPTTPIIAGLIIGFLATYIHSPIDFHFGPLRKIVVDNRFHRIHHSLEPRHYDRNFGICFSLWDRLFGTAYYPSPEEWPAVGVEGIPPPRSVRQYLMLPYDIIRAKYVEDVSKEKVPEASSTPSSRAESTDLGYNQSAPGRAFASRPTRRR